MRRRSRIAIIDSLSTAVLLAAMLSISGCSGGANPAGGAKSDAAGSGSAKRIIMLINGDVPFWDTMFAGMKDAQRDLKLGDAGYKVEMDKNDGTTRGQLDKLTQYANQTDVAAVAISPLDAKSTQLANALRKLRKQGIAVLTIDSDMDRETARDSRFAYMGTDNVAGGRELGKAALGLRPGGAKYAAFVGIPSAANAEERMRGFDEVGGSKLQRLDYLADDTDRSKVLKNVLDTLDKHPDVDMLVGIWSYNADGIAKTVRQKGIRDKVAVVCFDAEEPAIRDMQEGLIDVLVVQNPYEMGYDGVRLMKALLENDNATIHELLPKWNVEKKEFDAVDGDVFPTELRVVVPDDRSPLKKEMFEASTKFFTLPEFKQWLDERKLTNS
jgi:ribose transport system substrate-binding protein